MVPLVMEPHAVAVVVEDCADVSDREHVARGAAPNVEEILRGGPGHGAPRRPVNEGSLPVVGARPPTAKTFVPELPQTPKSGAVVPLAIVTHDAPS